MLQYLHGLFISGGRYLVKSKRIRNANRIGSMYSRSAFPSMIFYNKRVRAMELARLTDYFNRYNIINSMTFIKKYS